MPNSGTPPIAFKWEWNINTVAVLLGFVAGFIAWGYTLAELRQGREQNATNIEKLAAQNVAFGTRFELIERALSKMDQTDYRLTLLEKGQDSLDQRMNRMAEAYSNQFSDMRTQLSTISTQIALTNQSLNRIEAQGGVAVTKQPP
jgi:septation ring formation regulator EzrA